MAISYQVTPNMLTNPPSFTCRPVANAVLGYDEVAAQINLRNPTIPATTAKTVLEALRLEVKEQLAAGNTVNLSNFVSFVVTMPVKLAASTDPLPANPINISAKPSTTFKTEVQAIATYTRVPTPVKAPTLNSAYDSSSGIDGFCRNGYGLRISGSNLRFNADDVEQGVFLLSAAGNDMRQDNISLNDPSNLIVIPGLDPAVQPAGAASVEQVLTVRSKYTDNGSLRSGGYSKKLRALNVITDSNKKLFVTGTATSGPATVKTYTGTQVKCRILAQASSTGIITLSIAPLSGAFGQEMTVTANGDYVLQGLAANVTVTVSDYDGLVTAVNSYSRYLQEVCDLSPLT